MTSGSTIGPVQCQYMLLPARDYVYIQLARIPEFGASFTRAIDVIGIWFARFMSASTRQKPRNDVRKFSRRYLRSLWWNDG